MSDEDHNVGVNSEMTISSSLERERWLQRFRTITTMLAVLRYQEMPSAVTELPQKPGRNSNFKGSDAFATLLSRGDEVVALTRRITVDELQIVVFVQDDQSLLDHAGSAGSRITSSTENSERGTPGDAHSEDLAPAQWSADSFIEHAENILDLLGLPGDGTSLLEYVTAQTHSKMFRRITNARRSTPFFSALTSNAFDPQHGLIEGSPSFWNDNDEFLQNVLNDAHIMDTILNSAGIHFPRLREAASGFRQALYTTDTFLEFHQLLRVTLTGFRDALHVLQNIRTNDLAFVAAVRRCALYGDTLRAIAQSSAFAWHVEANIEAYRRMHNEVLQFVEDSGAAPSYNVDDQDIELILSTSSGWPYQHSDTEIFVSWLQLQTVYFRACRFADNVFSMSIPRFLPQDKKVLKVLAVKVTPKTMWPWKDLVKELQLAFIGEGCSSEAMIELLEGTSIPKEEWDSVQAVFQPDQPLSRSEFKGALHCQAAISSLVYSGQCMRPPCEEFFRPADLGEFTYLANSIGISQRCCPVCAELLHHLPLDGGCSITPAPAFHSPNHPNIQVVRGHHTRVTPCALPPWLPDSVIEDMVYEYEMELTRALESLWRTKVLKQDPDMYRDLGATDAVMFPDDVERMEDSEEEEGNAAIMAKAEILLAAMTQVVDGHGEADGG